MFETLLLMAVMGTLPPISSSPQEPSKVQKPPAPHLIPGAKEGELPVDSKDLQPVLLGATSREAILAHRETFRGSLSQTELQAGWLARWKAVDVPCSLVVAFGSWCDDSQQGLKDFLALSKEKNPFIAIHLIGVYRDKKTAPKDWPRGIEPQVIEKVPTFWLFELQPDGSQKLSGSIVETPPKPNQPMAEAVLDLLEKAR